MNDIKGQMASCEQICNRNDDEKCDTSQGEDNTTLCDVKKTKVSTIHESSREPMESISQANQSAEISSRITGYLEKRSKIVSRCSDNEFNPS